LVYRNSWSKTLSFDHSIRRFRYENKHLTIKYNFCPTIGSGTTRMWSGLMNMPICYDVGGQRGIRPVWAIMDVSDSRISALRYSKSVRNN
jgi:hypothetical protein